MYFETDFDFNFVRSELYNFDKINFKFTNKDSLFLFDFEFNLAIFSEKEIIEFLVNLMKNFPFETNKEYLKLNRNQAINDYILNLQQNGLYSSNELIGGNCSLYFNVFKIQHLVENVQNNCS